MVTTADYRKCKDLEKTTAGPTWSKDGKEEEGGGFFFFLPFRLLSAVPKRRTYFRGVGEQRGVVLPRVL